MRFIARFVLAMVLVAGVVATASAQRPQRPGGGFGGGAGFGQGVYQMIAISKPLQEEIKMSSEEVTALTDALKPIAEKRQEAMKGIDFRNMSEDDRKTLATKTAELTAETKKAVIGVLKQQQATRLDQIGYQMMGVRAFTNEDVQKQLKVTDEQKEKIKSLTEEYTKDVTELNKTRPMVQRGGGEQSEEDMKKMADFRKKTDGLRKEAEDKADELMTDEQRKMWKDMQGEKFDMAKLTARPRKDN